MGRRNSPLHNPYRHSPLPNIYRRSPLPFSDYSEEDFEGELIALVEIDWSAGTAYYGFTEARTPLVDYEDVLENVGTIRRAVSLIYGQYTIGTVNIRLINRDRRFSILWSTETFRNKTVRIKLVNAELGLSRAVTLFTGNIINYTLTNGMLSLECRDKGFDKFRQPVTKTLFQTTVTNYANLPDIQDPMLVPVIYGWIGEPLTSLTGGLLPTYLVNPGNGGEWRYVCAQHLCKQISVAAAYLYTIQTSSSFRNNATYNSRTHSEFYFLTTQADATRPDEMEITCDIGGHTVDGTSGGALIGNPVSALRHFLETYGECATTEFDETLIAAAIAVALSQGYADVTQANHVLGMAIVDATMTFQNVIEKACESFAMSFYGTRDGKKAVFVDTDDAFPGADFFVDDENDILAGSMAVSSNRNVASEIQYNHSHRETGGHRGEFGPGGYFAKRPTYTITGEATLLGESLRTSINLWYARNNTTATEEIAKVYAEYFKSGAQFVSFELPIKFYRQADLNKYVGITHWQGVSATGGYAAKVGRIIGMDIAVSPRDFKIRLDTFVRA